MAIVNDRVTMVLVSIAEIPSIGPAKLLVKVEDEDRELITRAADIAGLSQQKFMRAVLVSAAKKVLQEVGIA